MPTKVAEVIDDLRAPLTPQAKSRMAEVNEANAAMLDKQKEGANRFRCLSCSGQLFQFYQVGYILDRDMSDATKPQLGTAQVREALAVCQGCYKRYVVEMGGENGTA